MQAIMPPAALTRPVTLNLILKMDAELREQEDLIEKLEAEKRSAEGRTNSAIKVRPMT